MQDNVVIETHIELRDGQARFKERNLKVEPVARMHVNGGATIEEVMEHYNLSRAEVYAALTYFYDNQEVLDARYAEALEIGRQAGARDSAEFRAEIETRRRQQD
jgi:uncharacterized protein (DUF433 family)